MSWTREANTIINEYIREEEVAILRNRKLLALMMNRGRITFNHAGEQMDWKIRYKRAPITGYADSDTLTFARRERWKTAQLPWRGYAATDSMTKMERLKNKNDEAIIKVYEQIVPSLLEDMEENFCDELYIDGNASGNTKKIHGIESFMSYSGAATNGYVALPNDTYAGLDCTLGAYGGSWSSSGGSTTWPTGTGDSHYDFNSPLIIDYTDTAWAAGSDSWKNNCKEVLRFGIVKGKKNKSQKYMLDVILLNDELYRQFLDVLDAGERLNVQRGDKQGLYSLGFTDVVNFEGTDVTYEYGVPSNVGYGWCLDCLELCSLQGQLFSASTPDWDATNMSYRFTVDFFGNLKFKQTRNFVKWVNVT